jgi:hypothetical protein
LLFERAEQLARQTDGLRLVVSHRAEFEFQVHKSPFAHVRSGRPLIHYYRIVSTRRVRFVGPHA